MSTEKTEKKRVIVVGAGITGLSAARQLSQSCAVILLEADTGLGGKLQTGQLRAMPLDSGPDAFITRNPAALNLCRELGLGEELIAPAVDGAAIAGRRGIFSFPDDLVLGVPTNPRGLWRSPLLSRRAVLRSLFDLASPFELAPAQLIEHAREGLADPSIASLVRARLGSEICAVLVDPLLGGINAGDTDHLSFAAAAPQLAGAIAGRKSIMRALRPLLRTARSSGAGPIFLGLDRGIASLAERLGRDCIERGVEIRTSTALEALEVQSAGGEHATTWRVRAGEWLEGDAVVLAIPAFAAAAVLGSVDDELAASCARIPFAGVTTVSLAWQAEAITSDLMRALRHLGPAAFDASGPRRAGVLIPRQYGYLTSALSFTSSKWPRSANAGEIVIRASLGRYGDERAIRLDDEELVSAVRTELADVLGIRSAPIATLVARWPNSFVQYSPGHLARVTQIEQRTRRLGSLALAGASYHGIGIPACIDSAQQAAQAIAAHFDKASSPRP